MKHMNYNESMPPYQRPPSVIPTAIITSALTAAAVTVAVLFVTGSLRPPGAAESDAAALEKDASKDESRQVPLAHLYPILRQKVLQR